MRTMYRQDQVKNDQHPTTLFAFASNTIAGAAPNSSGLPSQMTTSFDFFRLRIFSTFVLTRSTASCSLRPAYLAAQLASTGRLCMKLFPSALSIASANVTFAASNNETGDGVSGGPVSRFFRSQESGAPRWCVKIREIFAVAICSATSGASDPP